MARLRFLTMYITMEGSTKELTIMLFRKEKKYYVILSDRELRLAKYALLQFRNKLLAEGKPAEDINSILLKLYK